MHVLFCDVSTAFDRLWHKGLIFKLNQFDISGYLLNCVIDYLTNRTQRDVIRSCVSSSLLINAGVLKGSVLGTVLFLVYVNDIADSEGFSQMIAHCSVPNLNSRS